MFIVLEGLDGAGKSTQLNLLESYFTGKGKQVKAMHFPRFDAPVYGELIAKFLRGDFGEVENVDPQVIGLVYAGDRREAAPILKEWLNQGFVVIVDRYVYSNVAYQCSKTKSNEEKQQLRSWVIDMEYNHFGIPKPDINIFLDVPLASIKKRLDEDRKGDDRSYLNGQKDIHEASFDLQRRVRELYLEQTLLDSSFKVVSCTDKDGNLEKPEAIFSKIKLLIENIPL